MNKYRIKLIFIISLFYSFPFCEPVKVINNLNSSSYSIRTLYRLSGTYISIIDFSKEAFNETKDAVIQLANSEGLHSHAQSIKIRGSKSC